MRRFSSEGCLLDIDFFSWRKVALKKSGLEKNRDSGTYTYYSESDDAPLGSSGLVPFIREPADSAGDKKELTKEHSVSLEDICDAGVRNKNLLGVCEISKGYRAYSDSQLAPPIKNGHESAERDDMSSPATPSSFNPFTASLNNEHHHKHRLSAAKLHLKSLFGQSYNVMKVQQNVSPHSSNSNLHAAQKDSAKERRSRLHFMRQWSQVGHSKKGKFSRKELETWAECLNSLLASQTGISVFGAFLRSEFSEENLQFYLACEQYRHSSNNFSLQRRAKDICATYIQEGAPREVNLDSKTRDLTIDLLQAPSHTSLSHAQKRIYSLLDTDCYPRFLQSNIYLSLLENAE